jgi:tungstate transport system substrate-binding protein
MGRSRKRVVALACLVLQLWLGATSARADTPSYLVLQSTTSTQSSGLFDDLLPRFTADSGIEVRVVAVGTGQALANCRAGNGDLALVHAAALEEKFVADGDGIARLPLMYNEFVIVGPSADPAQVADARRAAEAFARIAKRQAVFASRGDESGTHARERELWAAAGYTPDPAHDTWYKDTGSAMLATLNVAVQLDAYTLIDRATWATAPDHGQLRVLLEGDAALLNQYSLIIVNPRKHPATRLREAEILVNWLRGPAGQNAIVAFKPHGQILFRPNAQSATP